MFKDIYEKSPKSIKSLMRETHSFIPFPYVDGFSFAFQYNRLLKSQWWNEEKLNKIQNNRLHSVLNHAYKNVPFYKQKFDEYGISPDDIKSKEDLRILPIIKKNDVRKNPEKMLAVNASKFRPFQFESGGTTGSPLKFYRDKNSKIIRDAAYWRAKLWSDYNYGERWIVMRYALFQDSKKEIPYSFNIMGNMMLLSSFHLKIENIGRYLDIIQGFKPKAIFGFPSTLYVIAKYILNNNINLNLSLKTIFTSSETLFSSYREIIEEAFGCKIFDWYGSNEAIVSAGQCEYGGYHISEYGIIEIVDLKGRVCNPGKKGKVVATSLYNYAMPFIRYELGDIACLSNKKCSCGRGLTLLESIQGRLDDVIITKDESLVGRLDEAFHYSKGIKESQILQNEIGKITVKIIKEDYFSEKDTKILDKELMKRLGYDMDINYEFVDQIPRTRRGKYRFVVSSIIKDYLDQI